MSATPPRVADGIREDDLSTDAEIDRLSLIRSYLAQLSGFLLSDEATQHFTCYEAECMRSILELAGDFDLAGRFLESHSRSDEEGDDHYTPA